ncbi:MAG TPA: hypothetical protein VGB77_18845, partial [Abditibacteriaceae bacterium]
MPETGLVLAFYRDHQAAQTALKKLRQAGFRRVATLRDPKGQIPEKARPFERDRFARGGLPTGAGALLGGIGGVLLSRFAPPPLRATSPLIAPALGALAGAGIGHLASQKWDKTLSPALLKRHAHWLLRGETILIAQGTASVLSSMVEVIRETDNPALYVVREPITAPQTSPEDEIELHTAEQLREAARKLARSQKDVQMPSNDWLGDWKNLAFASHRRMIERVRDNERLILASIGYLSFATRLGLPVSIAGEWLLDNGYVIEGQIKDARKNLSPQFYANLPVLPSSESQNPHAGTQHSGMPRVYALAVELVKRSDSRLDKANISDWIQAYQDETPLTTGELWALPLMLRVAIVENLRDLSAQVATRQRHREEASLWANRLLNAAHHDPKQLPRLFADIAQENPQPAPHFADRLISNLYDEETALLPARSWIESTLGASLPEIMQEDQRRQASEQISVANCVTSLRQLANMDWRTMFESLSLLESELRGDAAGIYARMDFQTRDLYRHQVERLAQGSKLPELDVAQRVIEWSHQTDVDADIQSPGLALRRHIGYFLTDAGQAELEKSLNYQAPLPLKSYRFLQRHNARFYFGGIALGTVGALLLASRLARRSGARFGGPLLLLGVLPTSEVAIQIVNYIITRAVPSQPLPKMDFEAGIPDEARTIVVVPTLLLSEESIADDLEQLEIHYLANNDPNLRFALLGDYADAPQQHKDSDGSLLEAAKNGIAQLNARYANAGSAEGDSSVGSATGDRFFFFHRTRTWAPSEERWMGRERKRGKLEELNAYLQGEWPGTPDHSHPIVGDPAQLQGIKFVITLDADTQMPHDAARHMIETLAHPLNRPVIGSAVAGSRGREQHPHHLTTSPPHHLISRGYTIIQPRISTTLPSATSTRFARWFSGDIGLDPYTHVQADVYQDLFHEGSYHGKGIYDLEAFHRVLSGRFPPATLLSHDLLEGAHVRVGLASDIELLDDFPASYLAFAKRAHRWMRGDWQILNWISSYVPTGPQNAEFGASVVNPLSLLNRWKVFDNLRRSLLPPATIAFLTAGWLLS